MKTTKMSWRLKNLPTVDEINSLLSAKVITHDEAREILFNSETEEDRDKKSLESEIKFLRDLVERLSQNKTQIVSIIQDIRTPYYYSQPWYEPYKVWCGNTLTLTDGSSSSYTTSTANAIGISGTTAMKTLSGLDANCNFTSIKTF